jgi:hypothetical protein
VLQNLPAPEFGVEISFLELYQNKFYDLFDRYWQPIRWLSPAQLCVCSTPGSKQESKVKIRDERANDGSFNVTVTGLTSLNATTFDDVMTYVTTRDSTDSS